MSRFERVIAHVGSHARKLRIIAAVYTEHRSCDYS